MTTNYARGRALEYRVRDILVGLDYLVLRSAGSHSPVDLIAIDRDGGVLFVQCQRRKWIAKAKADELIKCARRCKVKAVLACLAKTRGKTDFYQLKGSRKIPFVPRGGLR